MTNAIVATVPVRSRPFLAAVAPDGRQLYVPNHDFRTVSVVDTATNTVSAEIRVAAHRTGWRSPTTACGPTPPTTSRT